MNDHHWLADHTSLIVQSRQIHILFSVKEKKHGYILYKVVARMVVAVAVNGVAALLLHVFSMN